MTTALLFPGQGSQSIGMLTELADKFPGIRQTFEEASEALGYDLWQLCQQGPVEKLNSTEYTQPAILTASIALYRLWQERNPTPAYLAGHSLGEYSALVASGVLDLDDAVALVRRRGELMQAAVEGKETAMAAVLGLEDEQVVAGCHEAAGGKCVQAVNFNCPGQVVIAGEAEGVERALEALKELGAKRAIKLPVSVPSHCILMKPAADALAEEFSSLTLRVPQIPVVQNVDAEVAATPEALRKNLIMQLYSPVKWTQTIQFLLEQGVDQFVECGPGKVLAGLVKKVDRAASITPLSSIDSWS